MLTRDACRTTSESFGGRRIACIVPVWATTQRTLLTCGAPLPNEGALQAANKRRQARGLSRTHARRCRHQGGRLRFAVFRRHHCAVRRVAVGCGLGLAAKAAVENCLTSKRGG